MLYFAYGSNIDEAQMQMRCPDAVRVSLGAVEGWRFTINSRSVATVVHEDASLVYGVLWHISDDDEQSLDGYEGVGPGLYSKTVAQVRTEDGKSSDALVYVAADDQPGHPRTGYLERIVTAALEAGCPSGYIEELRTWSATDA